MQRKKSDNEIMDIMLGLKKIKLRSFFNPMTCIKSNLNEIFTRYFMKFVNILNRDLAAKPNTLCCLPHNPA